MILIETLGNTNHISASNRIWNRTDIVCLAYVKLLRRRRTGCQEIENRSTETAQAHPSFFVVCRSLVNLDLLGAAIRSSYLIWSFKRVKVGKYVHISTLFHLLLLLSSLVVLPGAVKETIWNWCIVHNSSYSSCTIYTIYIVQFHSLRLYC